MKCHYKKICGVIYRLELNKSGEIELKRAVQEILAYLPIGKECSIQPSSGKTIANSEINNPEGPNSGCPILQAIEEKRSQLKLGSAVRILAVKDKEKPDKEILEEGSISCGPARWVFWGKSVFHYLQDKKGMENNVPIICEPGRFYVYNTKLKAVLIRLSPTTRDVHLTVPSAWRYLGEKKKKREKLYPVDGNGRINDLPEGGQVALFKCPAARPWLIAVCDTYREGPLLRGLSNIESDPPILDEVFQLKEKAGE